MIYVVDVLIIIALFTTFGISHSFLASSKFKEQLTKAIGEKIAFYRLFYNVSSLIIFYFLYVISPKPAVEIYDLPFPYDIIVYTLQVISLFGFIWSSQYINLKEFIGLSQITRYLNGTYDKSDLDESSELKIEGALKYCRHPIYLFSILFLLFRPSMDLFYLIFFIIMTLYFIIGSYFEERKLVHKFGSKYSNYQKNVKRLIPKIY
jgi:protein-S-isoprenylcysteine O-methyltransferase Ste14